jgi:hypothetical protein
MPGQGSGTATAASQRDSLVGKVQVVGADLPDVSFLPADGAHALFLRGPLVPLLRHADGLGVAIVGTRTGRSFSVDRFTVISANGVPATDGRLAVRGDTLVLITADGVAHALVQPPPALRDHVGGRAWVAGRIDQEPVSYGIIE